MARFYYECNFEIKNNSTGNDNNIVKPYACTPEKYCLYCCCNSQCCLVVQQRPPRHFWEAWYFWLGIALLAVFVIFSVSSYIVNNYRHIQGIPFRHNTHINGNRRNDGPRSNQNQISISIIPPLGMSPQRKTLVIDAQSSTIHNMTPVVA